MNKEMNVVAYGYLQFLSRLSGEVLYWQRRHGVEFVRIPAYWWGERKDQPAQPDEKIVVQFHGGGYLVCSHPAQQDA